MKLYLMRHGPTDAKRHKGGDDSVPLSESGRNRILKAGEQLRREGVRIGRFYSSPVKRAKQTAQALAEGLHFETEPNCLEALGLSGDPSGFLGELRALDPEAVIVAVTHEPVIRHLAGLLIQEGDAAVGLRFMPGDILELDGPAHSPMIFTTTRFLRLPSNSA